MATLYWAFQIFGKKPITPSIKLKLNGVIGIVENHHAHASASQLDNTGYCYNNALSIYKKQRHTIPIQFSYHSTMDVIFEPQRGKPFSIEVGFFDTVLEIKEKIQKYQGIPISKQTLVFNGHVLQDQRDVEHCEILQNSHVHLIVAPESEKISVKIEEPSASDKIQLLLRMPTSKSQGPIPIVVDLNDTIGRLKEKIHENEGVVVNQLMIHSSGKELQDHMSLRDSELSDHSEIDVSVKLSSTSSGSASGANIGSKKLKVMVLPKCGTKKIPVEVNAWDNVGELRKELQKLHQRLHFHLPPEGYFFIYKQNVMDDDRSFRWHHVGQGDTIEIFNGSVTGGS
ncbi:hypothetical protein L1049_009672 [Liquidambar formosana]|uniref:Ubiquitin-like domain-containing protein n=1 Tax=Liquidambar formosana TaxID=63359 RepID=A0AAP0N668_LIQFO